MIGDLISAHLKPGEYLQWTMWLQGMAQDRANSNARAGTAQKQITFEMLTGTGQCNAIETQIQSPPWWKTNCNNCSHLVLAVCFSICNYIMNFVSKWLRHMSYKGLFMLLQFPLPPLAITQGHWIRDPQ